MHLTATTPLAGILCLLILYLGPARGLVVMFAALPFGSAAAINLSGLGSIFVAELAMLSLCASTLLKGAGGRDLLAVLSPREAGLPLLILVVVTGIGAFFLPRINAGMTEVFTIVRQADGATIALRPLQHSGSNTGQFFRFMLSGLAFFTTAMALMRFATPGLVKKAFVTASCVHIVLALFDLLSPMIGLNLLAAFRNAYVAILDDQVLLGVRRLIGGFPEPSAFGIYTIGLYGFWLRVWFGTPRSILASAMLIVMIAMLVRSTSTAAYFGLVFYTILFFLWQLRSVARNRNAILLYAILTFFVPLIIGISVLAYQLVPALSDFMNTIVFDKLISTSGSDRMSWNLQALRNFADTYGLGAGIGSIRASGWAFTVLGSIGFTGAMLYLWFLFAILSVRIFGQSDGPMGEMIDATKSGCAAVFLLSFTILPQPNLGLVFFLMAGIVTGLRLQYRHALPRRDALWVQDGVKFQSLRV